MRKLIIIVVLFAGIAFLILNSGEAQSQNAACSLKKNFPYSGVGSESSSSLNMENLYTSAMMECDATLTQSLQTANNQCAKFCLSQSTPQALCLPRPTAPQTHCPIPDMQQACQYTTNPMSISCTVLYASELKCSCDSRIRSQE